ncbi:MAG: hypothetical protein ACYC6G_19455 [Desulfobaccales bacterium]
MVNISTLTKNPIATLSTTAAAGIGGAVAYLAETLLEDPSKQVIVILMPTISIFLQFGFSIGFKWLVDRRNAQVAENARREILASLGNEHISDEHRQKLNKDLEDIDNIRIGRYFDILRGSKRQKKPRKQPPEDGLKD